MQSKRKVVKKMSDKDTLFFRQLMSVQLFVLVLSIVMIIVLASVNFARIPFAIILTVLVCVQCVLGWAGTGAVQNVIEEKELGGDDNE